MYYRISINYFILIFIFMINTYTIKYLLQLNNKILKNDVAKYRYSQVEKLIHKQLVDISRKTP